MDDPRSSNSNNPSNSSPRFPPCDQCLQRKIRCDKTLPRCNRCSDSRLQCTREVVRRRPGRKKGSGAVISKLRSPSVPDGGQWIEDLSNTSLQPMGESASSSSHDRRRSSHQMYESTSTERDTAMPLPYPTPESAPQESQRQRNDSWVSSTTTPEFPTTERRKSYYSAPEYQTILSQLPELTRHVETFHKYLYPIWPLIPQSYLNQLLRHPTHLDPSHLCLILSISAISALHIPDPETDPPLLSPPVTSTTTTTDPAALIPKPILLPRQLLAQTYINQCYHLRSTFAYLESATIFTVQTSLFLSCAEVEFQKARSSWFLLRESIMLAQDLGFFDPGFAAGRDADDVLSIKRTLYLLSLVERGLTILRNKPFAIMTFDSPPAERFADEDPRVLNGLQTLSELFSLLDKLFLDTWVGAPPLSPPGDANDHLHHQHHTRNSTSDAHIPSLSSSTTTPPHPLQHRHSITATTTAPGAPPTLSAILAAQHALNTVAPTLHTTPYTAIQKADILITHSWLRLVFWQASMRQGLLRSTSSEPSLRYDFPIAIAKALVSVIGEISREAILHHGVAIFERVFEIAFSFIDALRLGRGIGEGVEELGVLFGVLRGSPGVDGRYVRILRGKLDGVVGGEG